MTPLLSQYPPKNPRNGAALLCLALLLALALASCARDPRCPSNNGWRCEGMPLLSAEGAKTESEKNDLIEWLGACAVNEQEKSGIPASITIAQTILETGWLKTDAPQRILMIKEAKNLFGIKGVGPAGSVEISTTEFVDGKPVSELAKFRAYRSYTESFEDHTRLLTTSDYYTGALQYRSDPRRYIEEVAKNYATDPQYAAKIWDIVTRYNLTRFDRPRQVEPTMFFALRAQARGSDASGLTGHQDIGTSRKKDARRFAVILLSSEAKRSPDLSGMSSCPVVHS